MNVELVQVERRRIQKRGPLPLVPNERVVRLRVYLAESELVKVREAAAANYQSMSEFARLALGDAAEECGTGPVLAQERRQGYRRRRSADGPPPTVERRQQTRRATDREP